MFSCWLKRDEVRLHRFETAACLTWCNDRLESTFKKQTNTKTVAFRKNFWWWQGNLFITRRELHYAVAERWPICYTIATCLCDSRRWWLRFVLRWNVALQDRENLEARRRILRCLWMWGIARFETKAFWSFARWCKILFLDFIPLKDCIRFFLG